MQSRNDETGQPLVKAEPMKAHKALVSLAKNYIKIDDLFTLVSNLVNVVGGSSKHRDFLREKQASKVIEALDSGEFQVGGA
ncbi:hypothetical protein L3X38_037830 [Prunus dulcis]|uniref:Uncharacterized protein n=1 Tax=Prunus dulcis TaxID=3755 RepID=A0AAD4V687_PRUDU|nr:hypothetical protein L3X38_037830 [Prunus dulcis]